jgi:dihydroorotate dehydrogenase (fumarate)
MPRLETRYLNLSLRNPLIVASSGLTKTIEKIQACEQAGAGAVVLKSLFEEVLAREDWGIGTSQDFHTEVYDYLRAHMELAYGPRDYCNLISEAKKSLHIPVIASINCVSAQWWPSYARQIEASGADAIELNIFTAAFRTTTSADDIEKLYYEIADSVRAQVRIPIALKLGSYFSSLPHLAAELEKRKIDGLVLFNRFTEFDIDIEKLTLETGFHFSTPSEMHMPLRWIAILAGQVKCDLAATTGIHHASDVIKMLLAGASAVQVASVLYKNGLDKIQSLLDEIESWMKKHQFESVDQFRGLLSFSRTNTPELYLRTQFLEKIRGYE